MTLFQLYMLLRDIQIDCKNAIEEYNNEDYSHEEIQINSNNWNNIKLGAEIMFLKVREHIQKESESVNF